MQNELTFEQINDHINKADLDSYKEGAANYFTEADVKNNPGGVLEKICSIYHVVRPFLKAILLIPFIPESWKKALRIFIELMDKICPA